MKIPKQIRNITIHENVIQIGAKTQIQAQSIFPVNFSVIKTTVKSPQKPMPPLLDDVEFAIIRHLLYFFVKCQFPHTGHRYLINGNPNLALSDIAFSLALLSP